MSQTYPIHTESKTRASTLIQSLNAGLEVHATRSELELLSGRWSFHDELCEDGRATCVHLTSTGERLFLTRDGMLLIVQHRSESDELYRCRWVAARPAEMWKSAAPLLKGLQPGRGGFRRFWAIREPIGPHLNRWGVYDLQGFVVLGWCARARATALVEELNSSPDSRSAFRPYSTARDLRT